jgi:hypothetical protein
MSLFTNIENNIRANPMQRETVLYTGCNMFVSWASLETDTGAVTGFILKRTMLMPFAMHENLWTTRKTRKNHLSPVKLTICIPH